MLVLKIGSPGPSKQSAPGKLAQTNSWHASNQIFDFWSHGW